MSAWRHFMSSTTKARRAAASDGLRRPRGLQRPLFERLPGANDMEQKCTAGPSKSVR